MPTWRLKGLNFTAEVTEALLVGGFAQRIRYLVACNILRLLEFTVVMVAEAVAVVVAEQKALPIPL